MRQFLTAGENILEKKNLDYRVLYNSAWNISWNIMLLHNHKIYTLKMCLIKNLEYNYIRKDKKYSDKQKCKRQILIYHKQNLITLKMINQEMII